MSKRNTQTSTKGGEGSGDASGDRPARPGRRRPGPLQATLNGKAKVQLQRLVVKTTRDWYAVANNRSRAEPDRQRTGAEKCDRLTSTRHRARSRRRGKKIAELEAAAAEFDRVIRPKRKRLATETEAERFGRRLRKTERARSTMKANDGNSTSSRPTGETTPIAGRKPSRHRHDKKD